MFYYTFKDKVLISKEKYPQFHEISEDVASQCPDNIYMLHYADPLKYRRSFSITDPSLLFFKEEGVHLLQKQDMSKQEIPTWLLHKIEEKKVTSVNTAYPNWVDVIHQNFPNKWRIHIVGLGDVGGILTTGLRLLGDECISEIGIYNKDEKSTKRWEYEANQVLSPDPHKTFPKVYSINENELFDCDMFVFCASVGVPPVGKEIKDVRTAQFQGNAGIIKNYGKMARDRNFKGIFAVLSDPVDLLCKVALIASNTNDQGQIDFNGLAPEQVRGYGLGVMHARAVYYAQQNQETAHYIDEGRAFGPHGEGLIIANSITNYNHELSMFLTQKAITANLEVRTTGYKPYIAPALSSGTLSIIATIRGSWHYSSTFMGGIFMGAKNRLIPSGTELEILDLPTPLVNRLNNTYERLKSML